MTKTMNISDFLPTISSEQRRNIRELAEWYQLYIDSLLEHSDYSFPDYLGDKQASDLGEFYDELDEMGVGFGSTVKTEIIGFKEIANKNSSGRPGYEYFTLVE
jgi:hypothetical protein